MRSIMGETVRSPHPSDRLDERLARIEKAIETMAWWLTQTPDSFGQRDAEAIVAILRGEEDAR